MLEYDDIRELSSQRCRAHIPRARKGSNVIFKEQHRGIPKRLAYRIAEERLLSRREAVSIRQLRSEQQEEDEVVVDIQFHSVS